MLFTSIGVTGFNPAAPYNSERADIMKINTIETELNSLAYHGRGIIIGKSCDGKNAVTAYFIMGRSENSRNRVFVADVTDFAPRLSTSRK